MQVNQQEIKMGTFAPGSRSIARAALGTAFGSEYPAAVAADAAGMELVTQDFLEARTDDGVNSIEYARRIGRGNLQAYAATMRARAARGW